MKFMIGICVTLCIVVVSQAQAAPLAVRCTGVSSWGGMDVRVQIEIALPAGRDRVVLLSAPKGDIQDAPDGTPVGIGAIQVNEQLGDATSSHRHQFIVTRLPDNDNSLIGFFLTNSYVNAIRADLWEKGKPFTYFDSYNNETVHGSCE